jgi:hypothetical protein
MTASQLSYPWYVPINGDEIQQGDILESCRVFLPPADLADAEVQTAEFPWELRDVIVMSQTCDLVKGREKLDEVLLCAVWSRSELAEDPHLSNSSGLEKARKGQFPAYHVLAECDLPDFRHEVRVVDFRRVYTLPLALTRRLAAKQEHVRLAPPYREHLAQAFARFFMRVGLPVDIPPFK